jgi:hypothetical protein
MVRKDRIIMTAHKVVILECDDCGTTAVPETTIAKDLIHMMVKLAHAGDARQHAHAKGWVHTAMGKDLCGNCRTSPGAPAKIHIPNPFHWGH